MIEQTGDCEPESIDPADVPDWYLVELARRRAEAGAKPGEGRPWRDVLDSLKATS